MRDRRGPVVVCGLVRNAVETLDQDVARIDAALAGFDQVRWLLVESDSSDDTVARLAAMKAARPGFDFLSLGRLADRTPERAERLALCRNAYLDRLREPGAYADCRFVAMADMDLLNDRLSAAAVDSVFVRDDWDVATASQTGPYYDIWALRHPLWSPNDCEAAMAWLEARGAKHWHAARLVEARQITLRPDMDWIEVDSAFGGFALYRREALLGAGRYDARAPDGSLQSEHVALHAAMRAEGRRLFVVPSLVNAQHTEHTSPEFIARVLSPQAPLQPAWRDRLAGALRRAARRRLLGWPLRALGLGRPGGR
ncbi:MAG: hypothetical protein AAF192_07205 [Pseudomonadota bacterium]